jgi:hypothetical protein
MRPDDHQRSPFALLLIEGTTSRLRKDAVNTAANDQRNRDLSNIEWFDKSQLHSQFGRIKDSMTPWNHLALVTVRRIAVKENFNAMKVYSSKRFLTKNALFAHPLESASELLTYILQIFGGLRCINNQVGAF